MNLEKYSGITFTCLNCGSNDIDLGKIDANPSDLVIVECEQCYYCLVYDTNSGLLREAGFNDN